MLAALGNRFEVLLHDVDGVVDLLLMEMMLAIVHGRVSGDRMTLVGSGNLDMCGRLCYESEAEHCMAQIL